MVLAGFNVISIQQISVTRGRKTAIIGGAFAVIGLGLVVLDMTPSKQVVSPPEVVEASKTTENLLPALKTTTMAGWQVVDFQVARDELWQKSDEGSYKAIGTKDTFAWTDEIYQGNLEISMDVFSPDSYGEASVLIYGDGRGMSSGTLILSIANDLQKISYDSVYASNNVLYEKTDTVRFGDQPHTILIKIIDRQVTLFLDGKQIASLFLDDHINTEGKIGLYKYWERPEITFSNIQINN
jgi:hypothetical protein